MSEIRSRDGGAILHARHAPKWVRLQYSDFLRQLDDVDAFQADDADPELMPSSVRHDFYKRIFFVEAKFWTLLEKARVGRDAVYRSDGLDPADYSDMQVQELLVALHVTYRGAVPIELLTGQDGNPPAD